MGVVEWARNASAWISALLNRKVATTDSFRSAVEEALLNIDSDDDGNVSVRELVSFILRCF